MSMRWTLTARAIFFIMLKDHKENFQNNQPVRLINPAKYELGRLSKLIIQAVNKELRHKLNLNQWKNTEDAIEWFRSIKDKH